MKCRVLKNGNAYITQNYSSKHKAVDLVAYINNKKTTDTVVAHTEGKVIALEKNKKNDKGATGVNSYGNYVQIEHSNGYTTFYAHLSKVYVKLGQTVKKGEAIGYMGDTGNSYGTHIHFEIRKNKTYSSLINPINYLNNDIPNYNNRSVSYRVYSNNKKKWLDIVNDGTTAGNLNDLIGGIQIKTKYGGDTKYRAHIKNGKWLPVVEKWDNTNEGYIGIKGKNIDAFTIWSENGNISYRAHIKNGKWLPWVTKYGINKEDEYAGIYGKEIDGIQIKIK